MTADLALRDKLRKIEALFAGATTPGEKAAAGAAAERIRSISRIRAAANPKSSSSSVLPIPGHGGCSWRYAGVMACGRSAIPGRSDRPSSSRPRAASSKPTLWPEFQQLNEALVAYLVEITDKVIREEVHGETSEAEEIPEPRPLPR